MGGRISDLAVYEKEPRIFYVGTASGGVWKTVNGGITLEPVMFKESSSSIGAVAVDPNNPDHVWAGTGEQNSRNSTTIGNGVFKSEDGGKTWKSVGLKKTRQIARIVIHPTDSNTVYVGALGHLWGSNDERGVYKTTDGGENWEKVLFVDEWTGIIEMILKPDDPDTIIAAAWQRRRYPWRWESGGPASALYKTTNGGKDWKKLTKGLPTTDIGRFGLSVMQSRPNVWVASVENKEEGGVYRSEDAGESWKKLNSINPRPFYFSKPMQDPTDFNRIYLPATQFHYSDDAGESFKVANINVHVDYHAIWVNPNDNNHLIVGSDGGVSQSRDRGLKWEHINSMPLGQFYAITADMRKPYWVYGGLQDNGSWGGPTQTQEGGVRWTNWRFVTGGDGFDVVVDPQDWKTVYSESQGGALQRTNIMTGERRFIRPRAPQGERYRFNWKAPIHLSPHNHTTLYFGGNKLFKSVNRGDSWEVISPDLSTSDPEKLQNRGGVTPEDTGAERHCTIYTISESPIKRGLLWVGTDDGQLHITKDDGDTWEEVSFNVPEMPYSTWVSRVIASAHEEGRAYAVFDGHRFNDYKPYVYVTEDYGQTWTSLSAGLDSDLPIRVIVEGQNNPDLLALGTEYGLFVSVDRGQAWTKYSDGTFATVRIDDLEIHPRELDLIVGTHGRSIWTVPFSPLEQLTAENREKDVFLCKPQNMYLLGFVGGSWFGGDREFVARNSHPSADIYYHLKEATTDDVSIGIYTPDDELVASLNATGNAGLNKVTWRPSRRARAAGGTYTVAIKIGEEEASVTSITVEDLSRVGDPNNDIGR
jgi:photosystem II stability/assembly factor-like uncharacterized protein